jgi:hypothetical protein
MIRKDLMVMTVIEWIVLCACCRQKGAHRVNREPASSR